MHDTGHNAMYNTEHNTRHKTGRDIKTPVFALNSVSAGYGEAEVLFDISLTLMPGECCAILGRNGMGKTTLLKVLMGQITPFPDREANQETKSASSKGKVVRMGIAKPLPPHAIARLGFALVPEGRQVFPSLTVAEHLHAFWRKKPKDKHLGGWTPDKVIAFLPALAPRLKHRGGALSGGEQQMLALGRALVTNPSLLILDEASEGLSPAMREAVWQCLNQLKTKGVAIVVVDQATPPLLRLADSMCILEKGRLVWQGSPASLTSTIARRYLGVGLAG